MIFHDVSIEIKRGQKKTDNQKNKNKMLFFSMKTGYRWPPFLHLVGKVTSVSSFQHRASVDLNSGGKVGVPLLSVTSVTSEPSLSGQL